MEKNSVSTNVKLKKCGEIFLSGEGDENLAFLCTFCRNLIPNVDKFIVHIRKCLSLENKKIRSRSRSCENDINVCNDPLDVKNVDKFEVLEIEYYNEKKHSDACVDYDDDYEDDNDNFEFNSSNNENVQEIPARKNDNLASNTTNIKYEQQNDDYFEFCSLSAAPDKNKNLKEEIETITNYEKKDYIIDEQNNANDRSIITSFSKSPQQKAKCDGKFQRPKYPNWYCKSCQMQYGSETTFKKHMDFYHNFQSTLKSSPTISKPKFICPYCNKSFSIEITSKLHMNVCDKKKKDMTSSSLPSLENMMNTITADGDTMQEIESSTILMYENHSNDNDNKEKRFKCDLCEKRFASKKLLKYHLVTHSGVKAFKCDKCDAAFSLSTNLKMHIRRHLGDKRFKCNYCDKRFCTAREKRDHENAHTGTKPYKCNVCTSSFINNSKFLKHYRTKHSDERSFKCEQCKKTFKTPETLRGHSVRHSTVKPYICEKCSKPFFTKHDLQSHLKIHSIAKNYICFKCGKGFKQNSGLHIHMRTHKEEEL